MVSQAFCVIKMKTFYSILIAVLLLTYILSLWTLMKVKKGKETKGSTIANQRTFSSLESSKSSYTDDVHFFMAGNYAKYNFALLNQWLKGSPSQTQLVMLRSDHPLFRAGLLPKEKETFERMIVVPVVQADFMKFLAMYYLGGVSTDFDTEPCKPYPGDWLNTDPFLQCDLFFGIEHSCYDRECRKANNFPRSGQIQTWTLWARRPRLPILRRIIDTIIQKLEGKIISKMGVQEVSGSGVISDILTEFMGQPYYDMPLSAPFNGTLKEKEDAILYWKTQGSTVCVLGRKYTACDCSQPTCIVKHNFEGTWKG